MKNLFDLKCFLFIEILLVIIIFLFAFLLKKVFENKKSLKSLKEKDLLLKEVQHRAKNNLALIIGLIQLQEELSDKKTKKALIDIQERIFSMELLHRKLYKSKNINYISFKSYVIDLVKIISHSYDISNNVLVEFKIEEINLNLEKAIPCGIVLNELITNAYKYAFTKQNKSMLKIIIYKKETNLIIIVKDNGKGLKENFKKINNKTLGLKLINKIVKLQLLGTIEYIYEKGSKFIIKIKDI
ncbi:sensor histidine kinase [Malaciobacter mytili]|uniref:histidine kinase n=1 Tax=Malaciobacter mytili LMG 24559 TaxID=1032238 RepID=A0AAX2AL86_9BACT|nr:sensor histidine kinase [Malaciobacter mytili]RXK16993.1 hypothetical protein CP985_00810 [Malaciobacter mytili LMG 24559]